MVFASFIISTELTKLKIYIFCNCLDFFLIGFFQAFLMTRRMPKMAQRLRLMLLPVVALDLQSSSYSLYSWSLWESLSSFSGCGKGRREKISMLVFWSCLKRMMSLKLNLVFGIDPYTLKFEVDNSWGTSSMYIFLFWFCTGKTFLVHFLMHSREMLNIYIYCN